MYGDSIEYLEGCRYGAWTCDELSGDGGYACAEMMRKMSKGLRIRIQPLGMHMARNVRIFANFREIFRFFGLMGVEQAHAYHLLPTKHMTFRSHPISPLLMSE